MTYRVAEKFKSLQGEGLYTGTPMAFIRFVGCSVGKRICQHCDTDFDTMLNWRGGGEFDESELLAWAGGYDHICLTGGEPFDQDLKPILYACVEGPFVHIETSGTVPLPDWFPPIHDKLVPRFLCVSPKPGWREDVIAAADEIKIIVPGLGEINKSDPSHWRVLPDNYKTSSQQGGELKRWPTLDDAISWAIKYPDKPIYLQPRNAKFEIDQQNLRYVIDLLSTHPQFRLSDQLHKILKVQ